MDGEWYSAKLPHTKLTSLKLHWRVESAPKEIEDALNDMDGIDESAVFGVPHPDFGESVIAAVVPIGGDLDIEEVKAKMAEKLARFKLPRAYVVLDELPRNTMGKVQKNVLRVEHGDG